MKPECMLSSRGGWPGVIVIGKRWAGGLTDGLLHQHNNSHILLCLFLTFFSVNIFNSVKNSVKFSIDLCHALMSLAVK